MPVEVCAYVVVHFDSIVRGGFYISLRMRARYSGGVYIMELSLIESCM